MKPDITITYFDVPVRLDNYPPYSKGRAEPARLALTIGGIPFSDDRIPRKLWPERKPSTLYKQIPTATLDGQVYGQSNAILRYCGKLAGIYPEDPKEALFADEIIDMFEDAMLCIFRYKGEDKKELMADRMKAVNEDFPRFFGDLETRLGKFGEGPWAVGGKISVADLAIYANVHYLCSKRIEFIDASAVEPYPKMMQVFRAVQKHPKVAEWNKSHAH